jgi:hypothetical protein
MLLEVLKNSAKFLLNMTSGPKIGPIGKNLLLEMSKTGNEPAFHGGKNLLKIHCVYAKTIK